MSSPRIRRLLAEHEEMSALQSVSSLLTFSAAGSPPTRYDVALRCTGVCLIGDAPQLVEDHRFEILLDQEFPTMAPALVWKTPIFHPNFRTPAVCMGDFWYPAWSIADMCVAICEMVQYKTFNVYDPLDPAATLWLLRQLDEDPTRFPVDRRSVRDLDFSLAPPRERG